MASIWVKWWTLPFLGSFSWIFCCELFYIGAISKSDLPTFKEVFWETSFLFLYLRMFVSFWDLRFFDGSKFIIWPKCYGFKRVSEVFKRFFIEFVFWAIRSFNKIVFLLSSKISWFCYKSWLTESRFLCEILSTKPCDYVIEYTQEIKKIFAIIIINSLIF